MRMRSRTASRSLRWVLRPNIPFSVFQTCYGSVLLVTLALLVTVLSSCLQMFLWLTDNFSVWQLAPSDGRMSLLSVKREMPRALFFSDRWCLCVQTLRKGDSLQSVWCWKILVVCLCEWHLKAGLAECLFLPQGWWPHGQGPDDALRHQQENHQAQEETGESHEGPQGEERAVWLPIILALSFWYKSPLVALLV